MILPVEIGHFKPDLSDFVRCNLIMQC